jgi:hypothetical protein
VETSGAIKDTLTQYVTLEPILILRFLFEVCKKGSWPPISLIPLENYKPDPDSMLVLRFPTPANCSSIRDERDFPIYTFNIEYMYKSPSMYGVSPAGPISSRSEQDLSTLLANNYKRRLILQGRLH